jgi:hypothetical protein
MKNKAHPEPSFKHLGLSVLILAAFIMTACSGGSSGSSGSTSVSALSLPDRIELTNVEDQNASSRASRAAGLSRAAYNDAGTDYANQTKNSWVDDTDALDMINTVLGVVKDTGYASFVNQGAYKALVRSVDDSKQAGSGSDTTSTTTEQLMEIYVNVTRASNSDPMIVKIWLEVPNGPEDLPMLVRGYFTVSQGVSVTYPFGVMSAHFKGNALQTDGSEGAEVMNMALSVSADNGQVILENVDDEFNGSIAQPMRQRRVQVVANADVTEGNAYVMGKERDHNSGVYPTSWDTQQIAFDSQYFKVSDNIGDTFYTKDNLKHRIFNYKLFNAATGAKIELSSGFPIQTAAGKHGYVGYYGLWAPYGTTISTGDTVSDMDGNDYTVFRSVGKLTKHTKSSMGLGALNGVELYKSACDMNGCQDTVVTWDSANSKFIKLGYRDNTNGQIVYYVDGVDSEFQQETTFQQWEGAWCESLRAYLRLGNLYQYDQTNHATATPSDASTVFYHAEETVDPSTAANLTLYTWEYTLDMPINQTGVTNYDTAMNNYWQNPPPTEKTFYFNATTMMLTDGSNPATLGDLNIPEYSMLNGGYHIGPMTTIHYYTNQSPYLWQANEAQTYYSWNTGSNDWNQLVTVKDSGGDFVSFEPPISFSYTHSAANDVNSVGTQEGKTFRLEYDGFSVMIPWNYDKTTDEWEPQINIKDGTLMGPDDAYVIKATDEALVMAEISDPGITFPSNNVGEPTLTYDATKTALVGAVPTTAQLKVIKGEPINN